TMAQPQVRSASLQSQAPQRKQQQLRVHSRPSPPLRSYPVRPQRTRSRVPMTRRFLHNAPWLSSVSRCLGPTQRRDPVSSSIGGEPHQLIAQRRPITASSNLTFNVNAGPVPPIGAQVGPGEVHDINIFGLFPITAFEGGPIPIQLMVNTSGPNGGSGGT